jgi:hypothetical protein
MENFQSKEEGKWVKVNRVELTDSEQTLLKSTKDEDKSAKIKLIEDIKIKTYTNLSTTKSKMLIGIYENFKPALKEGDVYQLIGIDISVGDKISGILNCRINSEHKQIRF